MSPLRPGTPSARCFRYGIAFALAAAPAIASADFEEVRILRTEPVQYQICPPPGQMVQAPQAVPQPPQQPMQQAQGAPPQQQSQPQPQQAGQPQQAPQPAAAGIGGREILGGVAGAAVGGLLGNQVGSGSGRTAATVAGAGVGAYAGYKLAEQKPQAPPPPQAQAIQTAQPVCTLATYYRVHYARVNGLQGNVTMSAQPTGTALMINFCGDRPCN